MFRDYAEQDNPDLAPRNVEAPHDVADDPFTSYIRDGFSDMQALLTGGSYSDFVANRNEHMDGWYSTAMDSIPILRNIHNAFLGREQAKDYMEQNNMSWKDMQGYNTSKLTGTISNNLGGAIATGGKYLNNIATDLGKLYQKE